MKKTLWALSAAGVTLGLVSGVFIFSHVAKADSSFAFNVFGTTSVLGVNLLADSTGASASQVIVFDMETATTSETYTLPALSSVSRGTLYFLKGHGIGNYVYINPNGSDLIDKTSSGITFITESSAILAADPAHGTWWVMSGDY